MHPTEYLVQAEPALRQLFAALASYRSLLEAIPVVEGGGMYENSSARDEAIRIWHQAKKDEIAQQTEAEARYFELTLPRNLIAAAILQIVWHVFQTIPTEGEWPADADISEPEASRTARRAAWGRQVYGLPLGLVVMAGRNQSNHIGKMNNPENIWVFSTLATRYEHKLHTQMRAPAFDIENQDITIYADNILWIIGWSTYEDLRQDMDEVIRQAF